MVKIKILLVIISSVFLSFSVCTQIEFLDSLKTDSTAIQYGKASGVRDRDYIALTNELIASNNFKNSDLFDYATYSKYCSLKAREMSVIYLNNLGICMLTQGNDKEASLKFNKAIDKQNTYDIDHDVEILMFNRAVANVRTAEDNISGYFTDALTQFDELPQEKFHANGILYYQGLAYMFDDDYINAEKKFLKDISINDSDRSRLSLCYSYYHQGKYESAYDLIKKDELSSKMESRMLFGMVASRVGEYKRAAEFFQKLPDSSSINTDFSEAIIDENESMSQHLRQDYISSVLLAGALAMSGNTEEAKELIEARSNLTKYGGRYTYGVVEFESNNFRNASQWFNKAKELNDEYPHAYFGIAKCKIANKNFEEALTYLSRAIELNLDESLILLECRSLLHFINNCPDCGVRDIEEILAINPDYLFGYETLKNHAYYRLNNGNSNRASELFQQCKKRFPEKSAGYSGLGIIAGYVDFKQAEKYFREAKSKEPGLSNNYSNLANCMRMYLSHDYVPGLSEREKKTIEGKIKSLYSDAIDLDSTNFIALAGLSSLQCDEKSYLLAVENGERAIEIAKEKTVNGQALDVRNLVKSCLLASCVLYEYSSFLDTTNTELSQQYFKKAVTCDSLALANDNTYNFYFLTNRAWFLAKLDRIDEAISLLQGISIPNPSVNDDFNRNMNWLKARKKDQESGEYIYYYSTPFNVSPPAFNFDFPDLLFQYNPEFEIIYKDFPIAGKSDGVCTMPKQ